MKLTCTFKPGKKPDYRYYDKETLTGKILDLEIDRKTFCNEQKLHGKADKKWSTIEGDIVCFNYEYNCPNSFKYFPNGDY